MQAVLQETVPVFWRKSQNGERRQMPAFPRLHLNLIAIFFRFIEIWKLQYLQIRQQRKIINYGNFQSQLLPANRRGFAAGKAA